MRISLISILSFINEGSHLCHKHRIQTRKRQEVNLYITIPFEQQKLTYPIL